MNVRETSVATAGNHTFSRLVHKVHTRAAGPRTAVLVGVALVIWVAVFVVLGFPDWMPVLLETVAAAVTLVMVFVIQHTQRRSEIAMQLKLDALIRASEADDELAEIEHADGDQLELHRRGPNETNRIG